MYNQDDSHGDDGKSYVHNEYDGNNGIMTIMAIVAIVVLKDEKKNISGEKEKW